MMIHPRVSFWSFGRKGERSIDIIGPIWFINAVVARMGLRTVDGTQLRYEESK